MSDEPSAVEYAAMKLVAYLDVHVYGWVRPWTARPASEQEAALDFVRAMKQASIEP